MANKTRSDLNQEIQDIIKANPGATDVTKLQGKRHRVLLADILDYVDEQVAAALAVADGEFPFPWFDPSNAFNNYSNGEVTFKSGFYKFLHREQPPRASLTTPIPYRLKGADTTVELFYSAAPGTAALASIVVDGTPVSLAPPNGQIRRATQPDQDTIYTMTVKDVGGFTTQAFAEVKYLNKLFIFSNDQDLMVTGDAATSAVIRGQGGELTQNRQTTSAQNTQTPNSQSIYIAYPVSFGANPTIIINNIQDNSFTNKVFNYTNPNGHTEAYYLFKSANILTSTYVVRIQ